MKHLQAAPRNEKTSTLSCVCEPGISQLSTTLYDPAGTPVGGLSAKPPPVGAPLPFSRGNVASLPTGGKVK